MDTFNKTLCPMKKRINFAPCYRLKKHKINTMAVLEKIRVQMGVFITVLIAIALISFIIDPGTLQSAVSMFSSKNDVGKMNGQSITYMEYSKRLESIKNLQQALAGSSALDEQGQEAAEQGTWQAFLKDLVYMPALEKAGIRLGNDEKFDMVQGRDISPVVERYAFPRRRRHV